MKEKMKKKKKTDEPESFIQFESILSSLSQYK